MRSTIQLFFSVVAGALGAFLMLKIGCEQDSKSSLRAERLEIVDNLGRTRAILGADDAGTRLLIVNQKGKEAIRLGISEDGSIMNLTFREGDNVLLSATAKRAGGTTVTLSDQRRSRLILGADPSDVDNGSESSDWGLKIHGLRSSTPVVSVNVHSDLANGLSDGEIFLTHPTGKTSRFPARR